MPRPRIDRELKKYLVNGERIVVSVRQHWFSLWKPILLAAVATFVAMWTDVHTSLGSGGQLLRNITLVFFWGSLAWLLWKVGNWRRDWFVATDKRFLLFYGFIRRRVAMMPLIKVTDMTFDRSPIARIIGYGTFVLESAGQDQALSTIKYVPDADRHYLEICTVLFGPAGLPAIRPPFGGGGGSDSGQGPDRDGGPGGPSGPSGGGAGPPDSGVPEGEEPGPAVVVGPSEGGVRLGAGDYPDTTQPESWYRSSNLDGPTRRGDTGEIPVVRQAGEDTDEVPLYPPRHWVE